MLSTYPGVSEVQVLEKAVRFWAAWKGEKHRFRVEAWKTSEEYEAYVYVRIQSSDGNWIWIEFDLPWTSKSTANQVISQAVSMMSEAGVSTLGEA